MKTVSVIIPSYKGSDKVVRAVKSVISQSYKAVEVIVVDDNGKGTEEQIKTENALKEFMECDNFKYIPHEVNRNGSAARNTGLRAAKGSYLCFLDDDDVYAPDKIKKQVEKFETLDESYVMLVGSVRVIESENYESKLQAQAGEDFLYHYLAHDYSACSSTVMIRASVMEKVKEWDESFRRHQDWEFFARVAASGKVAAIDDMGVIKYKYDNNLPKDGETTEKYRMHYLEKMKPLIDRYPPKQKKRIYDRNLIDIGKVYVKNKNIKDALRIAFKTSNPFVSLLIYVSDGLKFIKKRKEIHQ